MTKPEFTKKETTVCMALFGAEPAFIKSLLAELETRTMDQIVETSQFNIGFNEGLKTAAMQLTQSLETMYGWDQTDSINKELNVQPMPDVIDNQLETWKE